MALLNDSDSFLTNIERLPGFGGLYILRIYRKSHPLFDIVSSEQIQSEKLTNNKTTTIFIPVSSSPYFPTIKIKLRIWKTFI